ncbi:MAG: nucleotidyltransferase [Spirochaetota bacterium]
MERTKQEYLQDVLESYRMKHVEDLVNKHRSNRDEVKEALERKYSSKIYNPINSGSFAKHTAINTKFDLDIAVPFKKDSFATIEKMFEDVYDFLDYEYHGRASIRKQKVSIGMEFFPDSDGDRISLDIVPGRELNANQYSADKNMNLYVQSLYGIMSKSTYIQTNIQAQIDHIKAKESERKIIRLLKIWKNRNYKNYKSFLLELLVIKAFEKENITGNFWVQLKEVMKYIQNNVAQQGFSLKDPGNSGNDVINTLNDSERFTLSNEVKTIIENIESNENSIKLYFPENDNFKVTSSRVYGVNTIGSYSTPPNNQRFG